MKFTSILVSGILLFGLAACGESTPEGKAAEKACACAEPVVALYDKKKGGEDVSEDKINETMSAFNKCMMELQDEFKEQSEGDEKFDDKVETKIKELCPEADEAVDNIRG